MKKIWIKLAVLFVFGALCFGSMANYALAADKDTSTEAADSVDESTERLATPTLTSAVNVKDGVKVKWEKVPGAGGYAVYRKIPGDPWEMIATTASVSSYTDKTAASGTKYRYTVRAYRGDRDTALANLGNAGYWSGYTSPGITAVRLKAPALKSKVTATSKGIKLSWKSVSGAKGYAIYRKAAGGKWKLAGTTTSTSYTDTASLKNGKTYYYTIRAYRSSKTKALENKYSALYWSYYDTDKVSIVYTKAPVITAAKKSSSGVKLSWKAVDGVKGYAVFRKLSGGSWERIATTTSTGYTDKTASSDKTYYYAVRAYRGSRSKALAHLRYANYWSGYNTVKIKAVANEAMYEKAQSYSSSTKWLILTNCSTNKTGIFYGSKGNWEMKYYWNCSTGAPSSATKKGTFKVQSKGLLFNGTNYTCWYYTQWSGNYLFHSVLYKKGSSTAIFDGRLGQNVSHGCVRMSMDHAKWIYDNIPIGTTVVTY